MNSKIERTNTGIFTISESGVKKLKEILKDYEEGYGLMVSIIPGGCSGYTYAMDIVKNPEDTQRIEQDGISVYLSKVAKVILEEARLDYVDSLQGAGFKISGAKIDSSAGCECGNSFAI